MTLLPTDRHILYPPPPAGNLRRPFLTPIPDLPDEFLLVLDNTSLEKIKRCHKAAQAYLILGREARPRSAALAYGGAMHEGLEIFHKWQWANQVEIEKGNSPLFPNDPFFGAPSQDQAVLSYFASNPAPPDWRNPTSALAVLAAYRQRCDTNIYPDYEWEILSDDKGPIIERAFEIPMGVLDIDLPTTYYSPPDWGGTHFPARIHLAWSGRIDLIARISGNVHVVDHKTSSIDEAKHIQGFAFSSQTIGYVWAYREMAARGLVPDFNISRFCLNGIYFRKPAEGCSPTARGPKGGAPALSFSRSYFQYSDDRIARWVRDTQRIIGDFLHSVSENHFPLNDRACFDKFGCCAYYDACTIDKEESGDKFLMSEAFKEVTWNPTT